MNDTISAVMRVRVSTIEARNILTRTSGYLKTVSSHSLQPYVGCSFGQSLCGVGCYVQHNVFVTKGKPWGGFLVAKTNAAALYSAHADRERRWAHRRGSNFCVFMSSATDPFVPHEQKFRVTEKVLEAMLGNPPDGLIVQTHSHMVERYRGLMIQLNRRCSLRVHISVESDRDKLEGLPPPASSVEARLGAALALKREGVRTVITVAPLLPVLNPRLFFERIAACADAVVIDHFIEGDGSKGGARTLKTKLPDVIETIDADALSLDYRERMVAVAKEIMPGRVGVGIDGFAGRFLDAPALTPTLLRRETTISQ